MTGPLSQSSSRVQLLKKRPPMMQKHLMIQMRQLKKVAVMKVAETLNGFALAVNNFSVRH